MMQGYFQEGNYSKRAIFDIFYRSNPNDNGYSIFAGLAQVIEYIENLAFTKQDIDFLRSLNKFSNEFLDYLQEFKFSGTIYSVKEGSVIFPGEPLIKVIAPIIETHLIEGALLNIINLQCLIATKASRMLQACEGDKLIELGLRRAQGASAALYGSRAATIGGCSFTSNVLAGQKFGISLTGTHSHSWIMSFKTELLAFKAYASLNKQVCILLVDTYNTLKSGVPNAIKIFDQLKKDNTLLTYGIRLDSGDLAYLSKEARKMLDDAGHKNAIISASNDLDENIIKDLKQQGATITLWGAGTNLITSSGHSSFGGVYKLAAIEEENGFFRPKIKISESPEKINNPGNKKVFRLYDSSSKKIKADLITLNDEEIDTTKDLTIFHPLQTWKKITLKKGQFYFRELLEKVVDNGNTVYESPSILEIQKYCENEKDSLWEEYKRLNNPNILPVDLSLPLYNLKQQMISEILANNEASK